MGREIVPAVVDHLIAEIDRILQDVNCLMDLTNDHVESLLDLRDYEGPLVINKFTTSISEFDAWKNSNGREIRDIGLDGRFQHVVIRWRYGWVIEAINQFLESYSLDYFKQSMEHDTALHYYIMTRGKSSHLDNGIDRPRGNFDRILNEYYQSQAPAIAIEIAFTRDASALPYRSPANVLTGMKDVTKVIILLRFRHQSAQLPSIDDNWYLDEDVMKEMNYMDLYYHALKWYTERGICAVEEFDMSIHTWHGMRHVDDPAIHMRPYVWVGSDSVEDYRFRAESFWSNGQVEVTFPLGRLVHFLQHSRAIAFRNRMMEAIATKQGRRVEILSELAAGSD